MTAEDPVRRRASDAEREATVAHLVGTLVKESVYLASRSTRFIAVSTSHFRDATPAELVDSIVPGAGHMVPLERPAEVARLVRALIT